MNSREPCGRQAARFKRGSGVPDFLFLSGVMIDEFFLVLPYAPFEFVYEAVNGSVHVLFCLIGINSIAIYVDCGFGLVPKFFDGQDTMDVRHEVKVSGCFLDF